MEQVGGEIRYFTRAIARDCFSRRPACRRVPFYYSFACPAPGKIYIDLKWYRH